MYPRQLEAFWSPATEILFGGASEGGKSAFIRRALCRWCIEIPRLQCVLIRKKFADIKSNHVKSDGGFNELLGPLLDRKLVKITEDGISCWNGSVIEFKHCQDERQFTSAQGVGTHVLAIDEATQISPRMILAFRGWVRMSEDMKVTLPERYRDMFPRIIYTANPIGASLGFFRRTFVKSREPFEIEEVDGFLRQFIPSKIVDNPSADKKAQAGRLAAFDAATARANAIASLLEGNNAAGMAALTTNALANAAYGFQSFQTAEAASFLPTGNGSVGGGIGAFDRDINITVNTGVGDPNAIAEAIENLLREANSRGTLTNGILGIA